MTKHFVFSIVLFWAAPLWMPLSAAPANTESGPREILVPVMSWYSPLGALNGSRVWQLGGYRHTRHTASDRHGNAPLGPSFPLPETLEPGSPAFLDLIEKSAREELLLMKSSGFEVALYDMQPWPHYRPEAPLSPTNGPTVQFLSFKRWLAAAKGTGMKVGFFPDVMNRSGDFPKGYRLNADEWLTNLAGAYDLLKDEENLWRVGGKPVAIHFGTSVKAGRNPPLPGAAEPDGGWGLVLSRLKEKQKDFYFIADFRPLDENRAQWNQLVDGLWSFAPAGPTRYQGDLEPLLEKTFAIPMVRTVSPGYYNPGLKAFTAPDFERIHRSVLSTMASGSRRLALLTWNDFGEDTDIAPSHLRGRALLDVFSFYAKAFKSGRLPDADRVPEGDEQLVLAWPDRIPRTLRSKTPQWGSALENQARYGVKPPIGEEAWGEWTSAPYEPAVYYWARLGKPRSLAWSDGTGRQLPAGLTMGKLTTAKPGPAAVLVDGHVMPLPAILEDEDESDTGLHFRHHNLLTPAPWPKDLESRVPRPRTLSFPPAGDAGIWLAGCQGQAEGPGVLKVEDPPAFSPGPLDKGSKLLHLFSDAGSPKGTFSFPVQSLKRGRLTVEVWAPRRAGPPGSPPYGSATLFLTGNGGTLWALDFLDTSGEVKMGCAAANGGYQSVPFKKMEKGFFTCTLTWDEKAASYEDPSGKVVQQNPLNPPGSGLRNVVWATPAVGDGKRYCDLYIKRLSLEALP